MIYEFEKNTPKIDPECWVASNSVIIGKVELKKNCNIWFNTVLRGDIEQIIIGENSNVQDGSVIHTDPGCPTIIGNGVTVGHMACRDDLRGVSKEEIDCGGTAWGSL